MKNIKSPILVVALPFLCCLSLVAADLPDHVEEIIKLAGTTEPGDLAKAYDYYLDFVLPLAIFKQKNPNVLQDLSLKRIVSFIRDKSESYALDPEGFVSKIDVHGEQERRLISGLLENYKYERRHINDFAYAKQVRKQLPGTENHLSYSPDGTQIAISHGVFDTILGQLQQELPFSEKVDFNPKETRQVLQSGSLRKTAELRDLLNNDIKRIDAGELGQDWTYSADGQEVATVERLGNRSGSLKFWDAQTGNPVHAERELKGVMQIAYHPKRPEYALLMQSGEMRIYNKITGEIKEVLKIPELKMVAYSPKGDALAVYTQYYPIEILSSENLKEQKKLEKSEGLWSELVFSPDGKEIAASTSDKTKVWDVQTGKFKTEYPKVRQIAYNPRGGQMALAYQDGSVKLWDYAKKLKRIKYMNVPEAVYLYFKLAGKLKYNNAEALKYFEKMEEELCVTEMQD